MNSVILSLLVIATTGLHVTEAVIDFPQLGHLKAKVSPETQAQAAKDLIGRLVADRASEFTVKIEESLGPKDRETFQLSSKNGVIQITGTSGVAVAMGFYHYLKYYCNGQRTWAGQQTQLPPTLPVISTPVTITTSDKFGYYQNVCTESYSMAFWKWDRWEQEIDWMALHGINLPLAFVGQEAIFQRVYLSMGLTQQELDEHFGGPAFLAWARMGNIRGWGGPLPQMWITNKLVLQHKILDRMRSLGMIPVLPGFAGHVPAGFTRVFPNASVTRLGSWAGFNSTYSRTYLLDFNDTLFTKVGKAFIEAQINEYGTDHIYNADTFNEMEPASKDPAYLSHAGRGVFNGMLAGDPQAIWLMQGWLFIDTSFWGPTQVKALVTSVPQGRMIVLDLASETSPLYEKHQSYYGQPFIWCMLHNYGGTMELYGAVDSINQGPFKGRQFPNSTMIGIGLTPEGIHQNEVMYEFMMENSWRTQPRDVNSWIEQFATQRYGAKNNAVSSAWKLLMKSVYNATDGHHDGDLVLITRRPSPSYNVKSDIWYEPEDLFSAWDGFVNASEELEGSSLFHYDIADVSRNCLQVIALSIYSNMISAFNKNDTAGVKEAGVNMTNLLKNMDLLLASNERFLVGRWTEDARLWATDASELKLYEYNARNQITLWGPNGEISDYASKQWSGVTRDFYVPRWQFFSDWLVQLIQNKTEWDSYIFSEHILPTVEIPWTLSSYPYTTKPAGNPVEIARDLHTQYRPISRDTFFHSTWKAKKSEKPKKLKSLFYKKAPWHLKDIAYMKQANILSLPQKRDI